MGSYFQSFVDRDATADDAGRLAAAVIDWLVGQGVIKATRTNCVLAPEETGYPPGPNYEQAVQQGNWAISHGG